MSEKIYSKEDLIAKLKEVAVVQKQKNDAEKKILEDRIAELEKSNDGAAKALAETKEHLDLISAEHSANLNIIADLRKEIQNLQDMNKELQEKLTDAENTGCSSDMSADDIKKTICSAVVECISNLQFTGADPVSAANSVSPKEPPVKEDTPQAGERPAKTTKTAKKQKEEPAVPEQAQDNTQESFDIDALLADLA